MAAGPASRLGSTEPGDKTGPRPSPALALALYSIEYRISNSLLLVTFTLRYVTFQKRRLRVTAPPWSGRVAR